MTTRQRKTRIRALGGTDFGTLAWDDAVTDMPTVVRTGNRRDVIAGPCLARCIVSDAERGDVTETDGERTVGYTATLKVQSVRKMHWPERVYRRVRFWARGLELRKGLRRVLHAPLRLVNWAHKGKRLWVKVHCDRSGFLLIIHRVRGDEWRYEGCVLPGLRVRALWGMEWSTQLRRYGFEVWLEPRF